MRRALALLLLLLCAGFAASAASAAPRLAKAPLQSATLRECRTALAPADRLAVFRSRMLAVRGTARMSVTFTLLVRRPGTETFTPVVAPGLGAAKLSVPGIDVFGFSQEVKGLDAPAEYRARVSLRWIDAAGKTLRRSSRLTPVCRQPDPRADLHIEEISASRAEQPGLRRYAVVVRNDGRSEAAAFDIALTVDGVVQAPLSVAAMGPGDRRTHFIVARACRRDGNVRVTLDPDDRVEEAVEGDNAETVRCPT